MSNISSVNLTADMTGNTTFNNLGIDINASSSTGNITINETAGNNLSITTGSGNDTVNLSNGNDSVELGEGSDRVNISHTNLDINDNITDSGTVGTDTLNITSSGNIDSANLIDVSGFENLNLYSGDDNISFDNLTEFNNFINEFTDIVDSGGNDTLSFGSSSISGDLDFSKLSEFENLNLSSNDDNITLSGDEPSNINGGAGNDNFTLDFANIDNFTIDGGSDTTADRVSLTGTTQNITSDTVFGHANSFTNMEEIDFTNLNLDGTAGSAEFELTADLLNSWAGDSSTSLKLILDADDASKLKFTDSSNTVQGDGASSISAGTYTLNDNGTTVTLDIEIQ